jgi:ferrous iron transport protein B
MSKNISSDKLLLNEENYLLLGTPNVGKSTFFNMVSTSTAAVSNIDRMTVEENKGNLKYFKNISIIDLPGIYNLSHPIDEEVVVAQKICEQNFTKIINIVSASTLERDLLLTIQCLETGLLSTLVVNMVDEINLSSLKTNKLKTYLNNVNLILTQANNGGEVKKSIKDIKNNEITKPLVLQYPILVEKAIEKITSILPSSKISPRFFAIMILENNTSIIDHIKTNDMVL